MSSDIRTLIAQERIQPLFQPIFDGATGEAFGFEALSRGPANSAHHAPDILFADALRAGCLEDLERACTRASIRSFAELDLHGRLFLNLRPETLLSWKDLGEWLTRELAEAGVDPHCIVIELTEHGSVPQESVLASVLRPLRRLGCDVAIDDLGAGSSGLKTWSEIRPEFVKVDRYFVAGIESDPVRGEILRSVVEMGRATGSQIVAEGIEVPQQLGLVLELGVDYVQGFLLGRPQSVPQAQTAVFPDRTVPGLSADCAEHLAVAIPPVDANSPVAEVVEVFRRNRSWRALAVIEGGRPIGLVNRDELLILLSRPLHPEIYNRKPVTAIMDRTAVQIDARARLEQVSRLVTGQQSARHQEDFIITRAGAYLGLGRTIDLLRQITTQQIQMAKHANPLTGLPGNREIQAQLGQLINRRRSFVACHLDLDNFKPFNDTYGYQQGDQVLLHVAASIVRNTRSKMDFVGHIGGDDFVVLLRSRDWSIRLLSLLEDLQVSLVNFHSPQDRETGHMVARARDGATTTFPLLSVSIAAVDVKVAPGMTLDSVAESLRKTKSAAKARPGCSCMLSTDDRIVDLLAEPVTSTPQSNDTVMLPVLRSRPPW